MGATPTLILTGAVLYDAHNHLQDAWLAPHRVQVFSDLATLPIGGTIVNGTCETDWPEVTKLAREFPFIRPSYGLHPWNVGNATPTWRDALLRLLSSNPRAGVGEIGLDRWMLDRARPDDPRLAGLRRARMAEQIDAFVWQLTVAAERNLPVTIHCLDAWGALADVLRTTPRPARGFLLHAYGGSSELARDFAELGAYFSFNGYFLGERHAVRRAAFGTLPADRLLVETDAPAMSLPPEHRAFSLPAADGNPVNHPANLGATYAGLAHVLGVPLPQLETQIAENFRRFFD